MAYIPQLICATFHARKHFICVVDFRQISPIVHSSLNKLPKMDFYFWTYLTIVIRFKTALQIPKEQRLLWTKQDKVCTEHTSQTTCIPIKLLL